LSIPVCSEIFEITSALVTFLNLMLKQRLLAIYKIGTQI